MERTCTEFFQITRKNSKTKLLKVYLLLAFTTFALLVTFTSAKAAAIPPQSDVPSMQATALDPVLKNYGTITPGEVYLNPSSRGGTHGNVGMYGFENATNFTFFNAGTINLPATALSSYGMLAYTDNGSHLLTNEGSIYSSSNGANDAHAYGMQARASHDGAHSIFNDGKLYVSTTGSVSPAYAIEAYAGHNGSHYINNTGYIEAVSRGYGSHNYGMNAYSANDGNHKLYNSGTIVATAYGSDSNANGMDAATNNTGSHTLHNSGTIIAVVDAALTGNTHATYANGINVFVKNDGNHTVSTSGDIYATAIGNISRAYGIDVNSDATGSHSITNSGNIISFATGDLSRAYGIRAAASDGGNQTLINTGYISATNIALAGATDAPAHGMLADNLGNTGTGNHILINSGTVSVTSHNTDSHAHALRAYTVHGQHYLVNTGTLLATAHGLNSEAFGMYVQGTPAAGEAHRLYNTGVITASANLALGGMAFEAYGNNNYNVDVWATTLRPWAVNDAVFGASVGSVVNFAHTTLIVRPQVTALGIELNTSYAIKDTVVVDGVQGAANDISGNIAYATTDVPFLQAVLSGTDPKTATVHIQENINKNTTPGNTSIMQMTGIMHRQMDNVAKALHRAQARQHPTQDGMSGGSSSAQGQWQAFFTPYVSFVQNSSTPYDGNSVGMTAGAQYRVNEAFAVGAHVDLSLAHLSADIMDMNSKSTSIAFGVHAVYNFMPEWYISAQVSGAFNQTSNDYDLYQGAALHANNSVHGSAFYAAIQSGYSIEFASGHSLTPQVGFSYLSLYTPSYDIHWDNANASLRELYNMSYDDNYYNALYGTLNLTWRSEWALEDDAHVAFTAGLGLRQNLSGTDIKTQFTTLGNSYTTTSTEDMTTWLAQASLTYSNNNFSISLNYEGNYGVKQTVHSGNVMVRIDF